MNKKIRFLMIALCLVVLLGGSVLLYNNLTTNNGTDFNQAKENSQNSSDKTKAPKLTVYDEKGNTVALSSFEGKPTVINFWATWCGYCKVEFPYLQKAYDENKEEINFIFLNASNGQGESVNTVTDFMSENGYTFPIYYDTQGEAATKFSITGIPTTVFLDAEGYVVEYVPGMMEEETLNTLISHLLLR